MRGDGKGRRRQADVRRRVEAAIEGAMALAAALTLIFGSIFFCRIVSRLLG